MSSQQTHTDAVGFHSGELAVQRRAGVEAELARLRPMMAPGELGGGAPAFVAHASFAAITARDRDGRLWTSPLVGPPGFMAATTPTRLALRNMLPIGDPLHGFPENQPVGIVVMDFAAKRRVRINGTLAATNGGMLEVDVTQAYGNCPQYIHPRRTSAENVAAATDSHAERGAFLVLDDIALIRSADTFFLGTTHPERGNDASHRGGPTGFVHADHNTVEWPDYPGNDSRQFRQSRDRPERRAAVHRLRQRAHATAVGSGGCRLGEVGGAWRHRPLGSLHGRMRRRESAGRTAMSSVASGGRTVEP